MANCDQAHLILRAQEVAGEMAGGALLFAEILAHAEAGVDGEHDAEGKLRLALEDGDGLRTAVLGDAEVILGEAADDGAGLVSNVDEEVDQVGLDVEGGGVLGGEGWRKNEEEEEEEMRRKADLPAGLKPESL